MYDDFIFKHYGAYHSFVFVIELENIIIRRRFIMIIILISISDPLVCLESNQIVIPLEPMYICEWLYILIVQHGVVICVCCNTS